MKITREAVEASGLGEFDDATLEAAGFEIKDDVVVETDDVETRRFVSRIPVLRGLVGDRVPDVPALIGGLIVALVVLYGLFGFVSIGENMLDRRVPGTAISLLVIFFVIMSAMIFLAASSGIQRYLDERKVMKASSE